MKILKRISLISFVFVFFFMFVSCGSSNEKKNYYEELQSKIYEVTFCNWDGTVLGKTKVKYGEKPIFNGTTPSKKSDGEVNYVFDCFVGTGSDYVYTDTTLYAKFNAVPITDTEEYSNVDCTFSSYGSGYQITSCKDLKYFYKNDPNYNNRHLVLPSMHNGLPVVSIADYAFYDEYKGNSKISWARTVQFPKCLEEIGDWAFADAGFERVEFPSSIRKIGELSFRDTSYLCDITFNNGIREIGSNAFFGFYSNNSWSKKADYINIRIPSSVQVIGIGAFEGSYVDIHFYCEASSIPSGWSIDWHLKSGVGHPYVRQSTYYTNINWGV